jgi:hypothetical protein
MDFSRIYFYRCETGGCQGVDGVSCEEEACTEVLCMLLQKG